jgi:tetratricopeptide (TPR) repeat protein
MQTTRAAAAVVIAALFVAAPVPFIARVRNRAGGERRELLRLWEAGDFVGAFRLSTEALAARPLDYFLLTIRGFTAYQMGISQINSFDTAAFIDECIWSLRKALLLRDAATDGRVSYVLGKAYAYKGNNYADLTIKYLEQAKKLSYGAADIPEYLGLAYAAIGDYRGSVAAFSEALRPVPDADDPADTLLLAIARSYIALEEVETARAYLLRCLEVSLDSKSRVAARLLLAEVLLKQGDFEGAENEYTTILSEAGEQAEAHYQLGELYVLRGDTARARSEWRLAYKADPVHAKARARLNM